MWSVGVERRGGSIERWRGRDVEVVASYYKKERGRSIVISNGYWRGIDVGKNFGNYWVWRMKMHETVTDIGEGWRNFENF